MEADNKPDPAYRAELKHEIAHADKQSYDQADGQRHRIVREQVKRPPGSDGYVTYYTVRVDSPDKRTPAESIIGWVNRRGGRVHNVYTEEGDLMIEFVFEH